MWILFIIPLFGTPHQSYLPTETACRQAQETINQQLAASPEMQGKLIVSCVALTGAKL